MVNTLFVPCDAISWFSKGVCGLVKLEKSSREYKTLKSKFDKTWCPKKGRTPEIHHILKIVNPRLEKRLRNYVEGLPWGYRSVKQYYHGTQIRCDMLEYFEPCSNGSCAVCGISKTGFDPARINNRSWQRFGQGFYFAPNSSKAYDYPHATHCLGGSTSEYRCMLVCEVAAGCKYNLFQDDPSIMGPPIGYHSVYGKSKWMWVFRSPDLKYDELTVFDTEAIRPHYILFLEETS